MVTLAKSPLTYTKQRHGIGMKSVVLDSFLKEINALKPGNVSRYAAGHGMAYADFVSSAKISTPILCDRSLTVGKRILDSVKATRERVNCNTNLGMLLLFSPLIKSYESISNGIFLQSRLKSTLAQLTRADAEHVYQAIRLAKPGGLGRVPQHDVEFSPDISLLEAMSAAADRDLIARQYVSVYADVYTVGLPGLREFDLRWNSVEWATVACYLAFMASHPDSHIRRKFGDEVAGQVQSRAITVWERFRKNNNPAEAKCELLEFDRELKDAKINPGTSADMTAVSLLLYELTAKREK